MFVNHDINSHPFYEQFYMIKGSCKVCEFLPWATNMITWKNGGRFTTAMVEWPPKLNYTNYSYKWSEFFRGYQTWSSCLLPVIEIHFFHMTNCYDLTGGHYTTCMIRRPPHFQDIIFVTHDRNSHLSYEQLAYFDRASFYHGHGKKTHTLSRHHVCYLW